MDLTEFKNYINQHCDGVAVYDAGSSKLEYSFDITTAFTQAMVFYIPATLVLKGRSVSIQFDNVKNIIPTKKEDGKMKFEIICTDEVGNEYSETIYWVNKENAPQHIDVGEGMC